MKYLLILISILFFMSLESRAATEVENAHENLLDCLSKQTESDLIKIRLNCNDFMGSYYQALIEAKAHRSTQPITFYKQGAFGQSHVN